MFRIRRVYDDITPANQDAIAEVLTILRTQFPGLSRRDIAKLPDQLRNPLKYKFRAILFVAEGARGKIDGFALLFHAPMLKFCYLDYISAARQMTGGGIGGALYERIREEALDMETIGLFFECLPDTLKLSRNPEIRKQNAARLRFYERYGARPIINTAYETPLKLGDDNPPYLVYDDLSQDIELASHGVIVGICRIKRIQRKLGLHCRQKRKFRATTDSNHSLPVAGNILNQQFKVYKPNRVWVSDITYVPTDEGWLYLAGHKDLFNGEIVGYAMGERLSRNLVSQSLMMAVNARKPGRGLLHHSDRGSQYCSHEYQSLLERFGLEVSMSQTGNCYDNAPMESFWGILKQELIHHRCYKTRHEAMQDISEYIEVFYNRLRLQPGLGFLSPIAYFKKYHAGLLAE